MNVKRMMGSAKSKHLSVFILTSVIMFDSCVKLSSSQLQYVHFLPINNWNCSDEMEKICAVDTASETMNASSLTECTMRCTMKHSVGDDEHVQSHCVQRQRWWTRPVSLSVLCAVRWSTASETMNASSLTECTMRCMMKLDQCLEFNYYHSMSPNCALYNFRPKNYINTTDCQHYVVSIKMFLRLQVYKTVHKFQLPLSLSVSNAFLRAVVQTQLTIHLYFARNRQSTNKQTKRQK